MKREEIFEMAKHLDEKYILEAAPAPKKNINIKKRIITFGIAAAITASLSVGAYAGYRALNRESVGKHYDSSTMDKMEESGYVYNKETENKHFKLTLETALKDDAGIDAVITIKPISVDANKYITYSPYTDGAQIQTVIRTKLTYSDTGEKIEKDPFDFELLATRDNLMENGDFSVNLSISYKTEDLTIDPTRPIRVEFEKDPEVEVDTADDLFEGLSLDLKDIKETKKDKFYTDNSTVMSVSESTILVSGFDEETFFKERENMDLDESVVYFKDGTSKKLFDMGSYIRRDNEQGKLEVCVTFESLIDPDTIDYVVYAGHTYKRK